MTALLDSSPPVQFDRMPPHSIEAEMCLLCSLMVSTDAINLLATVNAIIDRDTFFQADHQIIFDAICATVKKTGTANALAVRERLIQANLFEECGGSAYLGSIFNACPDASRADVYAKIMRERYARRQAISVANDLLRQAYAPSAEDTEIDQILGEAASRCARVASGGKADEVHLLEEFAATILSQREKKDQVAGGRRILYRLFSLDNLIGGQRLGSKTIIGGKPGMGKSALTKAILHAMACDGIPVGLITVEESGEKVAENRLAAFSGIANYKLVRRDLDESQWDRIAKAKALAIDGKPFYVVETARRLSQVVSMAHLLATRHGCRVIAVDHLHILDPEAKPNDNRERQISKISLELKWLWKSLNVCGIECAQLNRGGGNERPVFGCLRDSGSLEQDADVVILVHREDFYRKTSGRQQEMDGKLEAIVVKNKDGDTGTADLLFDETTQDIRDWTAAGINGEEPVFSR